jgi:hypothetical protein
MVGKVEAWETQVREDELKDLLDVLRCEWSQHLANLAADDVPQGELSGSAIG